MSGPDWDLSDEQLRAAGSAKWTWEGPDVLPAWIAEMDVHPAPAVREALAAAVARGVVGYPPRDEASGLREATATFVERRYGLGVDPALVLGCGDVMAGVRLTLEVLCERAPVIVPVPAYPPFLDIAPLTGRPLVTVPCSPPITTPDDAPATLDLDAIDAALAAGARTVLLSQPHNPLGRAFTVAELAGLRDVVLRHGARVISDEIHAPLVLPRAVHVPYASLEGTAAHVTTVTSASKAFNVPGLKCAQLIAGTAADAAALRAVPHVANHGLSPLGLHATVAAYTAGHAWLDALVLDLAQRRDRFTALLAERVPTARWRPMEATYLAWVDASATGLRDPAATALATGRVMVHPGRLFGAGYEQFARVNLATSPQRLERIVDGLAAAWV